MGALKVLESDSLTIQNQIILNTSMASRMFLDDLYPSPFCGSSHTIVTVLPLFINVKYLFKGVQYLMLLLLRLLLKTFSWKTNFLHHLRCHQILLNYFLCPKSRKKEKMGREKKGS